MVACLGLRRRDIASALGVPEVVVDEVTLDRHDEFFPRKFGQAVAEVPEILEVYLVTGDYDYLLKVAASDTRDFDAFLRSRLKQVNTYVPPN